MLGAAESNYPPIPSTSLSPMSPQLLFYLGNLRVQQAQVSGGKVNPHWFDRNYLGKPLSPPSTSTIPFPISPATPSPPSSSSCPRTARPTGIFQSSNVLFDFSIGLFCRTVCGGSKQIIDSYFSAISVIRVSQEIMNLKL